MPYTKKYKIEDAGSTGVCSFFNYGYVVLNCREKYRGGTDIDKTYSMPKSRISYRKPRRISEAKRQQARDAMKKINECG